MTDETQSTQMAVLPKEFQPDFLIEKFKEVEDQVKPELLSVDDVEGRKRVKELALKINKSKDALDKPMRDYLRNLKALPKALELNARESKQRFEKLRESVLEPLNKAREWQDKTIEWLNNIPLDCGHPEISSFNLNNILAEIEKIDQSQIWPELKKKFNVAIDNATATAKVTLERVTEAEAQAAKIKQLEKEQAEADKRERIAAEQREKEAREIAAAAEAKLKASENNAEALAKKAAEDALEKERVRLSEIADQEKQQALERENDKQNRAKVNRKALTEMIAGGMDEEQAKMAIRMIAKGQVSNIKIFY